jgi:murein DD-endopeptidase MepM/ murein hydrolase activator NlpD
MLISPPFLPPKHAAQTEDDWLNSCMICGQPGDGAFPISFQLGWHGGVHLSAPVTGNQSECVRAVADGTVVFKRASTSRLEDLQHPQNYRGWSDNGCIVIRHDTAIGEGPRAETVTFFSVYMHMSSVSAAVVTGRRISRKAELGEAGQIYGDTQRKIHFEIVCDDASLLNLVGRSSGELNLSQSGRTDTLYGALYFALPVGTTIYSKKPVPQLETAHFQPPKPSAHAPQPALVPLTPA